MATLVNIQNLTKRTKRFRIDHQEVCVKVGRCFCTRGAAMSIHVAPLRKARNLNKAVLLAPEIQAAIAAREVRIEEFNTPDPDGAKPEQDDSDPGNQQDNNTGTDQQDDAETISSNADIKNTGKGRRQRKKAKG